MTPLRLSKRQSMSSRTVILRTTLTRTIAALRATSAGSFSTRSEPKSFLERGFLSFVGRLNFLTGFVTPPALIKGPGSQFVDDTFFTGLLYGNPVGKWVAFVGCFFFRVGKSLARHSPAKWCLCAWSLLLVFS